MGNCLSFLLTCVESECTPQFLDLSFCNRVPASKAEISEKNFSTLETRMRISHIQSRTSRRERDFLSPNLMLRDKTENNFFQSQASRRDRDLFFSISDYETRSRIFLSNSQFLRRERESIYCYLSQRNHILSNFFTQKFGEIFLLDPGVGATRLALCFST